MSSHDANQNDGRISVVVPSYNYADFIGQTLRSIFLQTRAPDELLVIDDGSTDNSVEVIEAVLRECPFESRFIKRENKGLCATLNEGFEKTAGEYFAYLGADDLWLPGFLESRFALLESQPEAVLAYGHAYTIDRQNRVIESTEDFNTFYSGDARPMLERGIAPISSTVFYRRSALERHRWNVDSRLEDYELYLYLSHDGPFAFDPRALSAWRLHGQNVSRDTDMMLGACLAALELVANDLGTDKNDLARARARTSLEYALIYARGKDKGKAFNLLVKNFIQSASIKTPGKILAHCIVPEGLKRLRADRRRQAIDDRFKRVNLNFS